MDIGNELPHSSLTAVTDDIARIKFYRNSIAHANRSCLSDETFLEIWNNVSKVRSFKVVIPKHNFIFSACYALIASKTYKNGYKGMFKCVFIKNHPLTIRLKLN